MVDEMHGLETVLRNLNKEAAKIEGGTTKGLVRAGIVIIRDVEKTPPIVPVDLGNLRASRYVVVAQGGVELGASPGFQGEDAAKLGSGHGEATTSAQMASNASGPMVTIGFSAFYAWFVHEKVGAKFKRPGAGPKFFESSFKNTMGKVLGIIASEARIK